MTENILNNVYVGLNIEITHELKNIQSSICSKYKLSERTEFHVTIAYFSELSVENAIGLQKLLAPLVTKELFKIDINGIGGAYKIDGNIQKIDSTIKEETLLGYNRVFWFSAVLKAELISFRNSLISFANNLNLSNKYLRPDFWPHLTIGSCNVESANEKWDVQDISKENGLLIFEKKLNLISNKLHITDSKTNPSSLFLIGGY